MISPDGQAQRIPLFYETNLSPTTIIAAPGAGWYIRVVKVSGTNSASNAIRFTNPASTTLWQIVPTANEFFCDYVEPGLFDLAENELLQLYNNGLVWLRINLTYELRQVGT